MNNIKYILMGPSASAGFDLLFQLIPKYINVKTIYAENFHSKRFFYTTIINDWGFFRLVPDLFEKSKVYVYDKDPMKFTDAKRYNKLTYKEVVNDELKVMDLTAITLCQENNFPILVFNLKNEDSINNALDSSEYATIIS